jgi:hypothetical protein
MVSMANSDILCRLLLAAVTQFRVAVAALLLLRRRRAAPMAQAHLNAGDFIRLSAVGATGAILVAVAVFAAPALRQFSLAECITFAVLTGLPLCGGLAERRVFAAEGHGPALPGPRGEGHFPCPGSCSGRQSINGEPATWAKSNGGRGDVARTNTANNIEQAVRRLFRVFGGARARLHPGTPLGLRQLSSGGVCLRGIDRDMLTRDARRGSGWRIRPKANSRLTHFGILHVDWRAAFFAGTGAIQA